MANVAPSTCPTSAGIYTCATGILQFSLSTFVPDTLPQIFSGEVNPQNRFRVKKGGKVLLHWWEGYLALNWIYASGEDPNMEKGMVDIIKDRLLRLYFVEVLGSITWRKWVYYVTKSQ